MQRKLTDTFVEGVKSGSGILRIRDLEVKGFGLRVTPAGHKSYIFQFTRGTRKVQATIGSAPAWSCDDLREPARELRKLHEDGKDARGTLKEDRKARDLEELVQCWREDYKGELRPQSQASYEFLLKRILPEFGRRLVWDLSLADVESFHRKIAREGYRVTANRAVTFLRRLLNIAERKGWRPMGTNPVSHLEGPSEDSRDRVLSGEELESFGAALRAFEGTRLDPDPIRFLALSGLRKREALGLKWEGIDLERGTMTRRVHKSSRKTGLLVLPINSHLRAILLARMEVRISPYVFAGHFRRVVRKQEDGTGQEKHLPTDDPLNSLKRPWGQRGRGCRARHLHQDRAEEGLRAQCGDPVLNTPGAGEVSV
jgi:integrase